MSKIIEDMRVCPSGLNLSPDDWQAVGELIATKAQQAEPDDAVFRMSCGPTFESERLHRTANARPSGHVLMVNAKGVVIYAEGWDGIP